MKPAVKQQIVISGVGGQGVLFVTRLIAEAAIDKGLPVLTSETHGMAQRGGTVVSHLKVGDFASPLIRPRKANGLLALKAEIPDAHLLFLEPDAWAVVNSDSPRDFRNMAKLFNTDCDQLALEIGNARSANLVLLGFGVAATIGGDHVKQPMFCSIEDIRNVLLKRFSGNKKVLDAAVAAIEAGYDSFGSKRSSK
ncbi:MAG: 2-oxoacid:acceptor oxidoreductase family protein [Deltaproteobacteria bacterium]|nr:2-oxoacid:acceptor oxidoreductase family protein [Deltaproteobacteria bacterium]